MPNSYSVQHGIYSKDQEFQTNKWFPIYSNGTLYLNSLRRDIGYYLRKGLRVDTSVLYKTKQDAYIECGRRNTKLNQLELELD